MANERTSKKAASNAGKVLGAKSSTKSEKRAAASTLAQRGNNKTTSTKAASAAGKVLASPTSTKKEKSAAGSALTQRTSARKRG